MKIYTREEALKLNNGVVLIEVDGQICFLKKTRKIKKHIVHFLQGIYYLYNKNILFKPTVLDKNTNSSIFEAEKIKRLKEKGLNVPTVVEYNTNYLIITCEGETLKTYIKNNVDDAQRLVEKAIEQLAYLHNKNEIHGGSQIRNYTYNEKEDKVSLIDFEENINIKDVNKFKYRDIFLFLISLNRFNINFDIDSILSKYEYYSKQEVKKNLKILSDEFMFLKYFKRLKIKDLQNTIKMLEELEKIGK